MPAPQAERLRGIKTLPQLLAYLRDELDWPIDTRDVASTYFEYDAAELGLDEKSAVKIKEIKQIRPLTSNQPWGIFFVNFEKKRLPVMVMRRILRSLVFKKRTTAGKSERQAWHASDLLFISAYGEERDRAITFAHFVENSGTKLAELRVLGWDDDDTPLHLEYVAQTLSDKLSWDARVAADPNAWREKWAQAFLLRYRHVVRTSAELALALAELAKHLRRRIRTILRSEDGFGQIRKLQKAFRDGLIHDLDDDRFADMFAQTVTYGLFSVACRRTWPGNRTALVKEDAMHYFTSPFLKEMLGIFLGLKSRKGSIDFDELGVSDITDLLTSPDTHLEAVLRDFNNKTRSEDPVIYFYEHFLDAYDRVDRKRRGIYYTPKPVVSYIVRSVHELLQTQFKLEHGLADTMTWGEMLNRHPDLKLPPASDEPGEKKTISPNEFFVQILDPATGTATFLVEVIDVIYHDLRTKWESGGLQAMPALPLTSFPRQPRDFSDYWNQYVGSALLPRLHGYELMMAPYAIADMRIGLKLWETGYRFGVNDRARIYLTNALEPWVKQLPLIGFDALAHEAAAVNEIKRHKRFTVVIGNPPYAGVSANMSETASALIEPYKFIDGNPLGERKHWLQDDYVKFLRLAQLAVESVGTGILGYITNHGYLDNPTFRGMRQNLMRSFSDIRVLDLHGSVKKRDETTSAKRDENVFDIEQGVAIGVFLRPLNPSAPATVYHSSLLGPRSEKYDWLTQHALVTQNRLNPSSPYYFFVKREETYREEYEVLMPVTSIFQVWSTGVQTSRDSFAIAPTRQELEKRLEQFLTLSVSDDRLKDEYGLKDMSFWKVAKVRRDFRRVANPSSYIKPIDYRPFDTQYVIFHQMIIHRPKAKVMRHMLAGENLALLLPRQLAGEHFHHALCTRNLAEMCVISTKTTEQNNLFPLYLYEEEGGLSFSTSEAKTRRIARSLNFTLGFFKALASRLSLEISPGGETPRGLTPEDIFHYAYAVFHSPGYRSRYAEFLKIDFPRLPLTGNLELFRALGRLGGELVALHLLESPKFDKPRTEFVGGRNLEIKKISWSKNTVWIDKAQTTGFKGVPEAVWNFHIGGYQVCEKWLKDRKGRPLSKDDTAHYHKIVIALGETIRLMAEIDKVIEKHGGWPGAFTKAA